MAQSSFNGFVSNKPSKGGTNTGDATATAADIATGKTAYAVGVKVTGTGSNMKSTQSGTTTWTDTNLTLDIPISSINIGNSVVVVRHSPLTFNSVNSAIGIEILNATTIRLNRGIGLSLGGIIISWEVYEFNNVKSKQTGNITSLTSASANTNVAVSTYVPTKSMLFTSAGSGFGSGSNSAQYFNYAARMINGTTLGFSGDSTTNVYWQLIEFN